MGKFIKNENLKTAEEMLSVLKGEEYTNGHELHKFGESLGCVIETKIGAAQYVVKYSIKKPKRALFTLEFREDRFRVKANLYYIDKYRKIAEDSSQVLKKCITSTRACTRCNPRCIQGSSFTLDGENYKTCIGSGHYFQNMEKKDWSALKKLLLEEKLIISEIKK